VYSGSPTGPGDQDPFWSMGVFRRDRFGPGSPVISEINPPVTHLQYLLHVVHVECRVYLHSIWKVFNPCLQVHLRALLNKVPLPTSTPKGSPQQSEVPFITTSQVECTDSLEHF
jgi:hypothetical protein